MAALQPRLSTAHPAQVLRHGSLEQLLPPEHDVRLVHAFVASLDLTDLLAAIRAVEGGAGRPAIDPRILLTLWLYATSQGVASARQLATLCREHLAYQWIVGGVAVGYHTLADFRTQHAAVLDRLLTDSIACLLHEGLIDIQRVAQDGLRVRAAAGAASFRRQATLADCYSEAQEQVAALRQQPGEDAGAANRRVQAARQRAAQDRLERLRRAQEELRQQQQNNAAKPPSQRQDPRKLRASTTDPEARRMKMPDGGTRPAYNVQLATTTVGGAIVGVAVTNEGNDGGQLLPMLAQIEQRSGAHVAEMVVDGGFVTVQGIDAAQRRGTRIYAPVRQEEQQLLAGKDPFARKKSDTDGTAAWRARMATAAARAIYRERGQTAEWSNAGCRQRGLYGVTVRGAEKVRTVALWQALVHNLWTLVRLRRQASGEGAR